MRWTAATSISAGKTEAERSTNPTRWAADLADDRRTADALGD